MSLVTHFLTAMLNKGIKPLDKIDDTGGKWRRAKIEGDKGLQKTLAYRLTIEGNFAFGSFINHREGVCHTWHSRSNATMSEQERADAKRRTEESKAKNERERVESERKAQEKAQRIWKNATPSPEHPYLARKGIGAGTARKHGDILYVPMYDGTTIVNLQCITPEGEKRFLVGGKKKGTMTYLAAASDSKDTIVICEGYATGMSIRQATALPVVVAFDAGNLLPVAEVIRDKYPDARIVFAADNDQWREGGNIGIERAKAALEKVGGRGCVKIPVFALEHPDRPTDWNDYHALNGIEAMSDEWKDITSGTGMTPPNAPPPPPPDDDGNDWQGRLIRRPNSIQIKPDSLENMILNLKHRDIFKGVFAWDEFCSQIIVHKCPPWENLDTFRVHLFNEADLTRCTAALERYGLNPAFDKVRRAVEEVAKVNPVHPPRDFFRSLKWDGKKRLDNWLIYYCGCEADDPRYVSAVGAKWLIAAVARIFEPGYKFDYILILEGREGARKSTLLEELVTFNGECYYTDAVPITRLDDKDSVKQMQGKMILELSELAGLSKKDMDEFKRWITLKNDQLVDKYEKFNSVYPRQYVIGATLNPAEGWLDDPTGGRRFWPVTVGENIAIDAIKHDKDQLWAEAYVRYKAGEKLYLTDEVYDLSLKARDERRITDPWHDIIAMETALVDKVTTDEIFGWLKIEIGRRGRIEANRIGKIMRRLGFVYGTVRFGTTPTKAWKRAVAREQAA